MLNGSITKSFIAFCVPIILMSFLQTLYNAADVAVVGNFAGKEAVAAIGATTPIVSLLVNVFVNISTGTSIILARSIGMKDKEAVRRIVDNSYLFSLIIGIAVMLLGQLLAVPLLELTDCPENVIDGAETYLRIYLLGLPATMFYNFMSTVIRVKGDTTRPFIYLTVSGIVNVSLNLFFVIVLNIPVAGVAIATVVAMYISAALIFIRLRKMDGEYKLHPISARFDGGTILKIVRYGIPSAISASAFSISNLQIQSAINAFGDAAISGNAAAASVEGFLFAFTSGFPAATSTFLGQNMGAGQRERTLEIRNRAYIIALSSTAVISVLSLIFAPNLISLFIPGEIDAIEFGTVRTYYIMSVAIFNAFNCINAGIMQACGYTVYQMLNNLIGVCGIRVIWMTFIYPLSPSPHMLYVAYPSTWVLTAVSGFIIAYRLMRKYKKGASFDL